MAGSRARRRRRRVAAAILGGCGAVGLLSSAIGFAGAACCGALLSAGAATFGPPVAAASCRHLRRPAAGRGLQLRRRASGAGGVGGDDGSQYQGVRWVRERWQWAVAVPDVHGGGVDLDCGLYDTEQEAARAYDIAQLVQDQAFPGLRAEAAWARNLPSTTVYQDEVDELREQRLRPLWAAQGRQLGEQRQESASAEGRRPPAGRTEEIAREADAKEEDAPAQGAPAQPVAGALDGSGEQVDATAGAAPPPGGGDLPRRVVVALYDCAAEVDDELSFQRGDRIEVLDDTDPDWWRGRLIGGSGTTGSFIGLLPSNYVAPDDGNQAS